MEIDRNPQEAARRMIKDGVPLRKVARMTRLSEETLLEIAAVAQHLPDTVAPQNHQAENFLTLPFPEARWEWPIDSTSLHYPFLFKKIFIYQSTAYHLFAS